MGQPVSKNQQGVAPFENYQGPPLGPPPTGPPPGLVTAQYNQSGGRVLAVDDGGDSFLDNEPPYLPQPQPLPRTARGNFGPPPRGMPRRFPFAGPPQDRSVVNGPGYASQLREGMMAEEAPRYWSKPPQDPRQPNIKTVRTVINEPRGYQPPGQAAQSYQVQAQPQSYQVQPQSYQVQAQPQTYQVQAQPQIQQPAHVMYYDPKTGALSSAGQQYVAPSGPVGCQTQSCAVPQVGFQQPQVLGFQAQPQVLGYQQPTQILGYQQQAQPVMFAYPQQQQAQPIVVPGQLYTANGGVQQLG